MLCPVCNQEVNSWRSYNYGKEQICTDCDNMRKYESGEEGFFLCTICGKADSPTNWIGGLPLGYCFSCSFWKEKENVYDDGKVLVIDGNMYYIGDESPSGCSFRGFGGRKFFIQKDGSNDIIETTNLWHNGKVPDRFKERFKDNAKFINPKEVKDGTKKLHEGWSLLSS